MCSVIFIIYLFFLNIRNKTKQNKNVVYIRFSRRNIKFGNCLRTCCGSCRSWSGISMGAFGCCRGDAAASCPGCLMLRFSSCCQTRCCVVLIGPITPPDVLVTRSGVRRCCGDVLWLIAGIRWRLWELQHAHSQFLSHLLA